MEKRNTEELNIRLVKPYGNIKLFKLSEQQDNLLAQKLAPSPKPREPFNEVIPERLGVRTTAIGNLRFIFLWPCLIGICLSLYWIADDFYDSWKGHERYTIEQVAKNKADYGDDYYINLAKKYDGIPDEQLTFKQQVDRSPLERYSRLENGKISLKVYAHYFFYESYAADNKRARYINYGTAHILGIIILSISLILFRRRAPLYFDPKRRLIYTWRKGHVWAQHYDNTLYSTSKKTLEFIMFGFNKKDVFESVAFIITPSGNTYYNSVESYREILSYVCHYMEKGFNSVATQPWTGRRGIYLFNDNKPEDFDEQLERIVTYLDEQKVHEKYIDKATALGWLPNDEKM